jgi:hypothetical protein
MLANKTKKLNIGNNNYIAYINEPKIRTINGKNYLAYEIINNTENVKAVSVWSNSSEDPYHNVSKETEEEYKAQMVGEKSKRNHTHKNKIGRLKNKLNGQKKFNIEQMRRNLVEPMGQMNRNLFEPMGNVLPRPINQTMTRSQIYYRPENQLSENTFVVPRQEIVPSKTSLPNSIMFRNSPNNESVKEFMIRKGKKSQNQTVINKRKNMLSKIVPGTVLNFNRSKKGTKIKNAVVTTASYFSTSTYPNSKKIRTVNHDEISQSNINSIKIKK